MKILLAAVCLGFCTQNPAIETDASRMPGSLRPIAGIAGFKSSSSLKMVEAPGDPILLEVLELFPDRARWTFLRKDTHDRRTDYRYGEHLYLLDVGQRISAPLTTEERGNALRSMALRRGAFLWPDGANWSKDGAVRTAPALALATDPKEQAIGELRAFLDDGGSPTRFEIRTEDGSVQETIDILERFNSQSRSWPKKLRLSSQGKLVWEEEVTGVEVQVRFVEKYFIPPDRKELLRPLAKPQLQLFPEETVLRLPLAPDLPWDEALAKARSRLAATVEELRTTSFLISPIPSLELSGSGQPASVLLHLEKATPRPPKGWSTFPKRRGVRLTLGGLTEPAEAELETLRKAIPKGEVERGLRVQITPGELHVDLLLDSN